MSSYGPPDRYGQPSDPWGDHDSRGGDPWSGDSRGGDPWGGNSRGGGSWGGEAPPPAEGAPRYDQPRYDPTRYEQPRHEQQRYDQTRYEDPRGSGYGGQRYEQAGGYPPTAYQPPAAAPEWEQPARRGPGGVAVALVVALAVLVLGGGATALYLIAKGGGAEVPSVGSTTTPSAGGQSAPATRGSPQPQSSAEGRFAVKGQCISNDGTDETPRIRIVKCAPGTFEVLARFDGTTDVKGKCSGVPGYQYHYYFDSQLDALDFVLCMKRR
ncbi:LppU/SCO3897 family protein [Rhizomonospora bruguierae]|uniref:LppU/SCO3897 family protein n=1 Tax=Rhizomonospora bruguierae TaxID=1581705 RepID=UPI001BCF5824|nr:hypothetical protein [Micromonospora sp. NBRC 107566]